MEDATDSRSALSAPGSIRGWGLEAGPALLLRVVLPRHPFNLYPTHTSRFPRCQNDGDRITPRRATAGWSVGDVCGTLGCYVYGTNGENFIDATAATQAEAWRVACEQPAVTR